MIDHSVFSIFRINNNIINKSEFGIRAIRSFSMIIRKSKFTIF